MVTLDGDGQHDPHDITKLVKPILEGEADVVIGSRFIENLGFQSSPVRMIGIQWTNDPTRLRFMTYTSPFDKSRKFTKCL